MPTCSKCGALLKPALSLSPVCTNCGGIHALYDRPVYAVKSPTDIRADKASKVQVRDAFALIARVAALNPDAGEIGAGMLRDLVTCAREICPLTDPE